MEINVIASVYWVPSPLSFPIVSLALHSAPTALHFLLLMGGRAVCWFQVRLFPLGFHHRKIKRIIIHFLENNLNMTLLYLMAFCLWPRLGLCKEKQRVLLKKKSFLARKRSGFTLFMIRLCTSLATHLSGYSLLTKMLLIVLKCRGMLALRWSSVGQETSTLRVTCGLETALEWHLLFCLLSCLSLPLSPGSGHAVSRQGLLKESTQWFWNCVWPVDLADHWCHTSCRPFP